MSDAPLRTGTASPARTPRRSPIAAVGHHRWSTPEKIAGISALAIVLGSLFLTTYSLALGDPVPRRIDAAIVGDPASGKATVEALQRVAADSLVFRRYRTVGAALHAIDEQEVYAALDLTSARPTLYVASAAGASVARVLERVSASDRSVRVVDTHPLEPHDPNGLDIFYLMLVTTVIGFITVFQVRGIVNDMTLRQSVGFVIGLALAASLVLTSVEGPLLDRLELPFFETWGILAMHLLAVASFASLMTVLIGRWAIVPTWLFFVILGNTSSGGAVAPPLLPPFFALISKWLPSGATVTSLRNAVYFPNYQHAPPLVVLATWAVLLFAAKVVSMIRRRRARPEAT